MPHFSPDWVQQTTGGQWLGPVPTEAATGFTIDSRAICSAEALGSENKVDTRFGFVAIPGPNFDGHDFVAQALVDGAAFAVVSDAAELDPEGGAVLLVPDTTLALQQLAAAHRDRLAEGQCTVISVSGSNGKTTTRHLIHHVLTHCGQTGTQSPKSFNNHLGVPLTLLAADPTHDFVAAEIGTNHPGEIDALGAIVRPDVAVITSIGEEHLEFFKDLRGVVTEEFAIVNRIKPGGALVVDLTTIEAFKEQLPIRADLDVKTPDPFIEIDPTNLPAPHLDSNGGLAIQVATTFFGANPARCERLLLTAKPVAGRWEPIHLGQGVVIINDAYNANPSSVHASVDFFARKLVGPKTDHRQGRRILVLGDMFELGDESAEAHRNLVARVSAMREGSDATHRIDRLIGVGQETVVVGGRAADPSRRFDLAIAQWSDDLPERIADLLEPGDRVLLKASRGMQLERLIPAIEAKFGPPTKDA